ncbi:hypothetical protein ACFQPA_10615 [Halomarina halobia]|uniref:Uncharacterized protein n=1 Tax=Halomarina halobia TaxID=3033386 RepID=A0ABD6AAL1_9EURY|nr:hypothetical protein [Halomarina sp. PSR21]
MNWEFETLLHGESDHRDWFVTGVYAAVLALLVTVVVGSRLVVGDLIYGMALPWLLVGTPPLASLVSAGRGGGLIESVVIGLLPTGLFALFALTDGLLAGALLVVAGVCLAGAVVGFVTGYAGRELLRLYQD